MLNNLFSVHLLWLLRCRLVLSSACWKEPIKDRITSFEDFISSTSILRLFRSFSKSVKCLAAKPKFSWSLCKFPSWSLVLANVVLKSRKVFREESQQELKLSDPNVACSALYPIELRDLGRRIFLFRAKFSSLNCLTNMNKTKTAAVKSRRYSRIRIVEHPAKNIKCSKIKVLLIRTDFLSNQSSRIKSPDQATVSFWFFRCFWYDIVILSNVLMGGAFILFVSVSKKITTAILHHERL